MKRITGLLLGFLIGLFCHYAGIPLPAPSTPFGALLVLAMTVGYLLAGWYKERRCLSQGGVESVLTSHTERRR